MDFGFLKMLIPILNKNLNNEKMSSIIDEYLSGFDLEPGELKNGVICTIEKGSAYLSVVGMAYNQTTGQFYITKTKQQKILTEAIKELLSHVK